MKEVNIIIIITENERSGALMKKAGKTLNEGLNEKEERRRGRKQKSKTFIFFHVNTYDNF